MVLISLLYTLDESGGHRLHVRSGSTPLEGCGFWEGHSFSISGVSYLANEKKSCPSGREKRKEKKSPAYSSIMALMMIDGRV